MPPGADNTVNITVQVIDANSGAVLTGVQQKLQGLGAIAAVAGSQMGALGKQATVANNAIAQTGQVAGSANTNLGAMRGLMTQMIGAVQANTAALQRWGAVGSTGGGQVAGGMGRAYSGMRLVSGLGREMGLNIDYGLRRALGSNSALVAGLSAAIPIFAAIGAIAVFAQMAESAYHFVADLADVDKALDEYIEKAREAAAQKLVEDGSLETTTMGLEAIGKELDELSAKKTHWAKQWNVDGTNITMPGAGFFQYLIPTSDIWDKGQDERVAHLAELQAAGQKHVLDETQKLDETRIRGQQEYDDAVDKGYAKVAAHLRDETALIHARYATERTEREQAAKVAGVRPDYSGLDTQESAEITAAQKKAQGERAALGLQEKEQVIKSQDEAVNARLAGISLLRAQQEQAIDAVTRKFQQSEISKQGWEKETAAIRARYDADVQKALDEQAAKLEQLQHEAESAGKTGIAKVQSDSEFQLSQINKDGGRDFDLGSEWNREQMRVAAKQKADADILAEQRSFGDEMAQIVQHNADQVLSGYAKIDAETKQSLGDVAEKFKKTYGQLDVLDPSQLATMVQGLQQAQTAVDAILQNAQREKLKYAQETDRQIAQTETEAARSLLPPWQAAQQKIVDDYNLRLQKIHDDVAQHVITEQQGAREVIAAWQLAQAEMVHQTEQARDQIAGQLQSFFDNPAKYMQQRAKQVMFDIMANWIQQASENSPKLQGLFGGIFGLNKVGTGSPQHALGQLFGSHTSATAQPLALAGSTLQTAGVNLNAAAQALYGVATGRAGTNAGGVGGGSGVAFSGSSGFNGSISGSSTPAGLYSGESLGLPTSTGGIGRAANEALGIAGSVSGGGSAASTAVGGIEQAVQLTGALKGAFSGAGSGQILNGGVPNTGDINLPPAIDAGGNVVPGTDVYGDSTGGVAGAGGLGLAGGALAGITGAISLFGGLQSAWDAPTVSSGLIGAASTALTGAGLGFTFGGPIGAGIGAAAGFAAGLVADLFGDHGRSKMLAYNNNTVIPGLLQAENGFSFGGGSYDSATGAINQINLAAQKEAKQWGSGAMDVYRSVITPEIQNAQAQMDREGAAGRSAVKFGVSQFHAGGVVTDFGDLWTSPTTGFIHAQIGEHITDRMSTAHAMSRSAVDLSTLFRGDARGMGSNSNSGGGEVHLHVHALDVQDFRSFLRRGGAAVVQGEVNQLASRYAGKALN